MRLRLSGMLLLFLFIMQCSKPLERAAGHRLPRLMLWAWERPEDLRAIDPAICGVAYLSKTLTLRGRDVGCRPRLQPLRVPPGTSMLAVTRIEVDLAVPFQPDAGTRAEVLRHVLSIRPGVQGIQLDFDARRSERGFYRELLTELRRLLDRALPLSMTALASWATGDDWLSGLPVDEVVPLCFDLGPDREVIRRRLAQGRDFPVAAARRAIGFCRQDPLPRVPGGRRIYVFNRQAWTPESIAAVIREVGP